MKGNVGPSSDTEWHSGGFSEMTLKGLGWTPRALRVQTRWTLWGLGWTPRGQSGWTWFLPWGQPSVERHGWLIGWLRTTFPIVEWSYHVTSMKESNIILLLYYNIIFVNVG